MRLTMDAWHHEIPDINVSRPWPSGRLTSDTTHLTPHQNERQMSVTGVISASRYRP
jgi:hypothetical protein